MSLKSLSTSVVYTYFADTTEKSGFFEGLSVELSETPALDLLGKSCRCTVRGIRVQTGL